MYEETGTGAGEEENGPTDETDVITVSLKSLTPSSSVLF